MRPSHRIGHQAGFSLVEVMVAVLVISIGLLGVAKMQALALSTTGSARLRALAALEAASLASVIRIDRNYWSAKPTAGHDLTVAVVGNAVTAAGTSDGALVTPPDCTYAKGNVCTTAVGMAGFDLQQWASDFYSVMSNGNAGAGKAGQANITCTLPTGGALPANPVSCNIQLTWAENLVAANSSQTTAAAGLTTAQYSIVVQP